MKEKNSSTLLVIIANNTKKSFVEISTSCLNRAGQLEFVYVLYLQTPQSYDSNFEWIAHQRFRELPAQLSTAVMPSIKWLILMITST